jgi:hypothetical protein
MNRIGPMAWNKPTSKPIMIHTTGFEKTVGG